MDEDGRSCVNSRMSRFLPALLLLVVTVTGCSSLPDDPASRREVYERRLARVEFPTTRQKLYKVLHPAAPARQIDRSPLNFMSAHEVYRLDANHVVELSVIYKAAAGASDFLNPTRGLGSRVRAILDTTSSIDNLVTSGSPNHPRDIIQSARVLRRPLGRY